MNPRLTIGLPVFNGERYLAAALGALISQSYDDFELIIADNASTDRSAEIARAFAAADPRIRYLRQQENLGAAANYNCTVEQSKGELFKWAAHDDVCKPDYLSRCIAQLDADPAIVLSHCQSDAIDAQGRVLGRYEHEPNATQAHSWERFAQVIRTPHYCIPVFGIMRTALLKQTAQHGDWVGADRNLLAELALHGHIALLDEVLFQRRDHPQSSIAALPDERERAAWFNPRHSGLSYPTWRRLQEYWRSLQRAPLAWSARRRCEQQLLGWMGGKHHGGERNALLMWRELTS